MLLPLFYPGPATIAFLSEISCERCLTNVLILRACSATVSADNPALAPSGGTIPSPYRETWNMNKNRTHFSPLPFGLFDRGFT